MKNKTCSSQKVIFFFSPRGLALDLQCVLEAYGVQRQAACQNRETSQANSVQTRRRQKSKSAKKTQKHGTLGNYKGGTWTHRGKINTSL